jgi:hypothetical protein
MESVAPLAPPAAEAKESECVAGAAAAYAGALAGEKHSAECDSVQLLGKGQQWQQINMPVCWKCSTRWVTVNQKKSRRKVWWSVVWKELSAALVPLQKKSQTGESKN